MQPNRLLGVMIGLALAVVTALCVRASYEASQPRPSSPPRRCITRTMRVTAYCPCRECCGPRAKGITKSGHRVRENGGHMVVADPCIPFDSRVVVPGYAGNVPVPVWDRGGAIKGDCIDVLFPTHAEALRWGVRRLTVRIYLPSQEPSK